MSRLIYIVTKGMLNVCYIMLYSFEIIHILCNKSLYLHQTVFVKEDVFRLIFDR